VFTGLKNESQPAAEEAGPSTTMVDYYKVLEIQRSATTTDIKKSYVFNYYVCTLPIQT
jgi:hypothetical protein